MATSQERWECPNCGTPLNIASLGIYAKVACPACGQLSRVHSELANFHIEGVLGLGGMSVVLRARDLVLERPLAIKLLNEFYRDQPERMARFEQECELMAKVRHENVVSVYSAGHVKGQFYIAMELVNGRNLEELVREQGAMPPLRALEVLRQVVLGLDAAYRAGLLHRDMKPGNILICDDGVAKVLDFGLSLGKRDEDTEEIIWATPYYVPPETLMREPEDPRTDMYALGMTLRHLLTGQHHFDPPPEGIEAMLDCKRNLPRMVEMMPGLPEPYCDLIDHMTAYEPAARPENYASLLEEIAEVRAALVAEGQGGTVAMWLKRSLPLLAGGAATLTLGALAAALASHLATPEPERLYVAPPATLAWAERDTLAAAMAQLQAGNTQEATVFFAALADSEGEPTACAWAAWHVYALEVLQGEGDNDGSLALINSLERHLKRSPAPAGAEIYAQMKALAAPGAAPATPFLQAVLALRKVEQAAGDCREREMKQHLKSARTALRAAGDAYAPVVELLEHYSAQLQSTLSARANVCYKRALAGADMPEAARALALMTSAASDEAARSRLAVQKEALALVVDAVEMMRRHSLLPAGGVSLSPELLPSLLDPLGNSQLVNELSVLLLVAEGRFDEAAQVNPYAPSPDSPEPFAVLMRDWLARVK